MSPRSKKEYTEAIHLRYKNASHHEKSFILDEFCATCGYHRKHAIRLLRGFKRFAKPKTKNEDDLPVTKTMKLSSNPSNRSGWQQICPAQNG